MTYMQMPDRRTRRRPLTGKMASAGIRHPGLPCPAVMVRRADWLRDNTGYSTPKHKILAVACEAYFKAYLERALMCPVRYMPRESSWSCRICGVQDRYERIVPAWVSLRAEGDPDDEREVWCDTVNDTVTIRCLGCGEDDCMDEIPRPDAVLPDWSIGLDGIEQQRVF